MEMTTCLSDVRKMQGVGVDVFKSTEVDPSLIALIAIIIVSLFLIVILVVVCVLIYKKIITVNRGKSASSQQCKENQTMVQQKTLDLHKSGKINPQECAELLGAVSETKESAEDNQQETQTPEH